MAHCQYLIKLGGSVLTVKDKFEVLNSDAVDNVVAQLQSITKLGKVCLVHGAGSFGHFQASKFKLSSGNSHQEYQRGVAETRASVQRLHTQLVSSLVAAGINAVSVAPCGSWSTINGNSVVKDNIDHIKKLLANGFVPVVHGDVVLDASTGVSILGGDRIIHRLSAELIPKQVVFVTNVDGIFTMPPEERGAKPIRGVPCPADASLKDVLGAVVTNKATHDATGGFSAKIQAIASIVADSKPEQQPTISVISGSDRILVQICGVLAVNDLLKIKGTHIYPLAVDSVAPKTITYSVSGGVSQVGRPRQLDAMGQRVPPLHPEPAGVGVGAGAGVPGAAASRSVVQAVAAAAASTASTPIGSSQTVAMSETRLKQLQGQAMLSRDGRKSKNQKRLAWYNEGPGRELRLSSCSTMPHRPEESKRRYCAMCGTSVYRDHMWRRQGRRTPIRCSVCMVNLCVRNVNGSGKSCWALFHDSADLTAKRAGEESKDPKQHHHHVEPALPAAAAVSAAVLSTPTTAVPVPSASLQVNISRATPESGDKRPRPEAEQPAVVPPKKVRRTGE